MSFLPGPSLLAYQSTNGPNTRMKFLHYPCLTYIQSLFSGLESQNNRLHLILEVFSCKQTTGDRRLARCIEEQCIQGLDDPNSPYGSSPFGPLTLRHSRMTLIHLISTLNAAFPDYDFRNVQPEQFVKEPDIERLQRFVDTNLAEVIEEYSPDYRNTLWKAVFQVVDVANCDIYSFISDEDSDPFADEGCIWAFNYFFYDKDQKKILFFCARAVNPLMCEMDVVNEADFFPSTTITTTANVAASPEDEDLKDMYASAGIDLGDMDGM
eukprot:gnl/Trimastix_PCT/2026.p1 GENE.gnl/Trimastix_PCT/2026~~gnl/Trimastix_PCT/2026.p1  ORF type:complete len:267 (+),score=24.75 gnl/Trimastix_PCT/2026:233-1033(+)